MKRTLTWIVVSLLIVVMPRVAHAKLQVVGSVSTLAALARDLGGAHVDVSALALHTQDPHFVDAKPSLALKLRDADLLLVVGLGLEVGWLPALQTGSRNGKIQLAGEGYLDCSRFAQLLDRAETVDRSKGDIHPGGNPHYLYDPRQIEHVAIGVATKLSELDPDHKDDYSHNLGSFLKKLHKLRIDVAKRMESHRGDPIISYHRSWVYVTDWLGLKTVAHLEPKPGIPPNPRHVAKVLALAKKYHVKAIIQERFYPANTAKLVASKSGARALLLPGGVDFAGGETVLHHISELASALEAGLR